MQADGKTSLAAHALQNTPEQTEPVQLGVKGMIPPWLAGSLYRTGPGTYEVPLNKGGSFKIRHWFDGFGMNVR
jgi:torulene dioxygenase